MSLVDQILSHLEGSDWIPFDDLAGTIHAGEFTSEEAVIIACVLRDLADEGRVEVRMKDGGIIQVRMARH